MSQTPSPETEQLTTDRRHQARIRRAFVRSRITMAADALAFADLLLGMNASVASVGRGAAPRSAP